MTRARCRTVTLRGSSHLHRSSDHEENRAHLRPITGAILSAMMLATLPFLDGSGSTAARSSGTRRWLSPFCCSSSASARTGTTSPADRRVRPRVGRSRADLGRRLPVLCRPVEVVYYKLAPDFGTKYQTTSSTRRARTVRARKRSRTRRSWTVFWSLSESCHQRGDHLPGAAARSADRLPGVGGRVEPPEESGLRADARDGWSSVEVAGAAVRRCGMRDAWCDESPLKH